MNTAVDQLGIDTGHMLADWLREQPVLGAGLRSALARYAARQEALAVLEPDGPDLHLGALLREILGQHTPVTRDYIRWLGGSVEMAEELARDLACESMAAARAYYVDLECRPADAWVDWGITYTDLAALVEKLPASSSAPGRPVTWGATAPSWSEMGGRTGALIWWVGQEPGVRERLVAAAARSRNAPTKAVRLLLTHLLEDMYKGETLEDDWAALAGADLPRAWVVQEMVLFADGGELDAETSWADVDWPRVWQAVQDSTTA